MKQTCRGGVCEGVSGMSRSCGLRPGERFNPSDGIKQEVTSRCGGSGKGGGVAGRSQELVTCVLEVLNPYFITALSSGVFVPGLSAEKE